jgi:hypothetical protein
MEFARTAGSPAFPEAALMTPAKKKLRGHRRGLFVFVQMTGEYCREIGDNR